MLHASAMRSARRSPSWHAFVQLDGHLNNETQDSLKRAFDNTVLKQDFDYFRMNLFLDFCKND